MSTKAQAPAAQVGAADRRRKPQVIVWTDDGMPVQITANQPIDVLYIEIGDQRNEVWQGIGTPSLEAVDSIGGLEIDPEKTAELFERAGDENI